MFRRIKHIAYQLKRLIAIDHTLPQRAVIETEFDRDYYLEQYPDVKKAGADPVSHFMEFGWLEGRRPNPNFDPFAYLFLNPDVRKFGKNPFYHYIQRGKMEKRRASWADITSADIGDYVLNRRAHHIVQNQTFPPNIEKAERIMVIVVPEHNTMSGGIYSFFSIAKAAYNLRHRHDYAVVIMTRPNVHDITYLRQTNFRNSEDVFRFEQIKRCRNVKTLYLLIPEYAGPDFIKNLDDETIKYLTSVDELHINILNQKIDLMPARDQFDDLRAIVPELTQSVAHHAYYGQEFADRYDMPMLLLPAYTDLSGYEPIKREEKARLIIYSPDEAPHRKAVLDVIKSELPEYRLVEIKDITFDKFMDLATQCLFSISFGEGFDGYVAQPIYQGGIGMTVYNKEFFPCANMKDFPNIFIDEEDMKSNVANRIRELERDMELYEKTNQDMMDIYNSLYSKDEYLGQVEKLIRREFEIFPQSAPSPACIRL